MIHNKNFKIPNIDGQFSVNMVAQLMLTDLASIVAKPLGLEEQEQRSIIYQFIRDLKIQKLIEKTSLEVMERQQDLEDEEIKVAGSLRYHYKEKIRKEFDGDINLINECPDLIKAIGANDPVEPIEGLFGGIMVIKNVVTIYE